MTSEFRPKPDGSTVTLLREIGRHGTVWPERRDEIARELERRRATCCRDDVGRPDQRGLTWAPLCQPLTADELADLFRGLVIAEVELKLPGGSASSAIAVAQLYSAKARPQDALIVFGWSIEFSGDWYIPFGSAQGINDHFRARSAEIAAAAKHDLWGAAWSSYNWVRFNRAVAHNAHMADEQEQAERRKAERAENSKTRQEQAETRRADVRKEIEAARGLDLSDRLQWLAETALPLPAIPPDLFAEFDANMTPIGLELAKQLRAKLQSQRPKHWVRLLNSLPGVPPGTGTSIPQTR